MGIYDEFLGVNERSYTVHVRRGFVLALIFPTLQLFAGLGTAVLLYAGGYYTYLGIITAGAWFLFMNSVSLFWFPMINLSAFWSQFQGALSATERIFALIDAEPAVFQTRSPGCAAAARRHPFRACRLSLRRKGAGAARLLTAHPARRERGACRPHGRRQVEHHQAGDALL